MSKHEIVITYNEDCGDPDDSVCIGFDFTCPICGKFNEIEPSGLLSLFYIDTTYARSMKQDTLIRCSHCKMKFRTISEQNWWGKVIVETIERKNK